MAIKKSYEIVVTDTKEILETIEDTWSVVEARVKELNKQGKGVFARKTENNPDLTPKRSFSAILDPAVKYIFVDAWTSGNPGLGGYRGVNKENTVLFSMDSKMVHSNNFFELFAIVAGLEHAVLGPRPVVVYSDSKTAMAWIANNRHAATADQESITKLIVRARKVLDEYKDSVKLLKWDTSKHGEIPADYGRK